MSMTPQVGSPTDFTEEYIYYLLNEFEILNDATLEELAEDNPEEFEYYEQHLANYYNLIETDLEEDVEYGVEITDEDGEALDTEDEDFQAHKEIVDEIPTSVKEERQDQLYEKKIEIETDIQLTDAQINATSDQAYDNKYTPKFVSIPDNKIVLRFEHPIGSASLPNNQMMDYFNLFRAAGDNMSTREVVKTEGGTKKTFYEHTFTGLDQCIKLVKEDEKKETITNLKKKIYKSKYSR